jgi:spore coat protein U domain-containing protein, fimbrial subunit CupE1/2/3/6
MRKHSIAPVAAGLILAVAGSAQAATKTTTFGVSATVAPNCLISAANLAFGNYLGDPDAPANVDSSSDISVRCSKNAGYSLALSAGTTSGATFAQRLLAGPGGEQLQYNLYTDSNRNSIWGDGTNSTGTVGGTGGGMGVTQTKTVYGRLPDNAFNQAAATGAYNDTITVTVTY